MKLSCIFLFDNTMYEPCPSKRLTKVNSANHSKPRQPKTATYGSRLLSQIQQHHNNSTGVTSTAVAVRPHRGVVRLGFQNSCCFVVCWGTTERKMGRGIFKCRYGAEESCGCRFVASRLKVVCQRQEVEAFLLQQMTLSMLHQPS